MIVLLVTEKEVVNSRGFKVRLLVDTVRGRPIRSLLCIFDLA